MGETTGILWTDATVNFWWGCTKVGPGCDHCYAETLDKRIGGAHWGRGAERRPVKSAAALIMRLNKQALAGARKRVFIQSMADLFDLEVPDAWLADAWALIEHCSALDIQIVTKRISVVEKRLAAIKARWPRHAGLMVTVVNQPEADRDVPRLLDLKARLGIPWVGVSAEPLLGPIDFQPWLESCHAARDGECFSPSCPQNRDGEPARSGRHCPIDDYADPYDTDPPTKLDWIIVGGESGPGARPMHPDWARSIRDQCAAASVPFFFKQWGEWGTGSTLMSTGEPISRQFLSFQEWVNKASTRVRGGVCLDKHGNDLRIGADMMRARDENAFPVTIMDRVGKHRSGRLLDGREHSAFPRAAIREAAE